MNAKQIWQSTLERIQPKITPATFHAWFDGTSAVALDDHLLTVRVGTTFNRAHLETRFHDLICSVLWDLMGPAADVCFEVGHADEGVEVVESGDAGPRIVEADPHTCKNYLWKPQSTPNRCGCSASPC